jgi:hypothetical protein
MYSSLAETPIDLVRQEDARFRSGVFFTRQLIDVARAPQSLGAPHYVAKIDGDCGLLHPPVHNRPSL